MVAAEAAGAKWEYGHCATCGGSHPDTATGQFNTDILLSFGPTWLRPCFAAPIRSMAVLALRRQASSTDLALPSHALLLLLW